MLNMSYMQKHRHRMLGIEKGENFDLAGSHFPSPTCTFFPLLCGPGNKTQGLVHAKANTLPQRYTSSSVFYFLRIYVKM